MRLQRTFQGLILRLLGLYDGVPWELDTVVRPVSIVDQDITLTTTSSSPVFGTPASAGEQVAPAPGTVLADSGQLAAGNYEVLITIGMAVNAVGNLAGFRIQHRDSGNAADVWAQLGALYTASEANYVLRLSKSFAANERIRVVAGVVSAGETIHANVFTRAL